jgi:AraC family transcriptional regulator of adaptative response/methylated-DNA-[protein]-cysteine methyltransferase
LINNRIMEGMSTVQIARPTQRELPFMNEDEMYAALVERNPEYDGVFFVGVKTTGIFCRPTCPAKKPLQKNVTFHPSAANAMAVGYRACRRCRPMEIAGQMPAWLLQLMSAVESDPTRRWKDQDLREFGVEPSRAARWFKTNHGITFHGYIRCRRLAAALGRLSVGDDPTRVAMESGYESLSGFREAFAKWLGTTPGAAAGGYRIVMVNRLPTPLGPMVVAADDDQLLLLEFADRRMLETQIRRLSHRLNCQFIPGENDVIAQTASEIGEYFAGRRRRFSVRHAMVGSEFQQAVWRALTEIPYGETRSYAEIANAVGKPGAGRAVGRANGDNRLAIILPCHRVIRSDGTLSGYGGGVRRKEWLVRHERCHGRT